MVRGALFILLAFVCSGALAPAQSRPSAADFVAEPAYHSLSLSPDGRFLAAARRIQDQASIERLRKLRKKRRFTAEQAREFFQAELPDDEVIIFDLQGELPPRTAGVDNNLVSSIRWASNQKVLITVSVPVSLTYWTGVGTRTLSLDINSGEGVFLLENRSTLRGASFNLSDIVHILPDDPDHILMAAYREGDLDLWKVNINDGTSDRIERASKNTFRWVTTRSGEPAFRLDTNSRGTIMHAFAKVGKNWKKISTVQLRQSSKDLPTFWPIGPGRSPDEIIIRARLEDEDRLSLKSFNLETGEIGETIVSHPEVDIDDGIRDYATGEVLGGVYYDDRLRTEFRDKSLQRHIEALDTFFGEEANINIENYSRQSGFFLLRISGPVTPGEYYIYDSENARIEPIFSAYPNLERGDLSPSERVTYRARDGQSIQGILTHPSGQDRDVAPLIVMPHGGPEERTVYGFHPFVQFLANRGYRVFQPNFRGSTGRGRQFTEAGYGEWGGKMQDDVTDGVEWLIDNGLAERNRICIVGGSYGGYAALYGAVFFPDLYACAVATAGVSDLIEFIGYERKEEGSNSGAYQYWLKSIGHPRDDKDKLIAKSPARHADKLRIPLLIVHGDADEVVPLEQTELMREALDEAGRPYELLIIPDERHSFRRISSKIEYFETVETFLNKHLPAEARP